MTPKERENHVRNMLLDGEDYVSVACWIVNNAKSSLDTKALIIKALNLVEAMHK